MLFSMNWGLMTKGILFSLMLLLAAGSISAQPDIAHISSTPSLEQQPGTDNLVPTCDITDEREKESQELEDAGVLGGMLTFAPYSTSFSSIKPVASKSASHPCGKIPII